MLDWWLVSLIGPVWTDVRFPDKSPHRLLKLVVFAIAIFLVLVPCIWGVRKTMDALNKLDMIIKAEQAADADKVLSIRKDKKTGNERDVTDPATNMNRNPIFRLWWQEHTRVHTGINP